MSYIVRDEIPILDEHVLKDKEGRSIQKVTESDLRKIADNNNRRVKETGDYCPVVIGHTRDGAPEHEQPEIVGHAYNFRVGNLFKTGRKAIFCTMRFFRDKYNKCKGYPRRSVEYWPERQEIDPISLLGATSPERDLGLMQYSKVGRVLKYSRLSPNEEKMNPNEPAKSNPEDEIVDKVLAKLMQSDAWKKLEAMAEEFGAQGGEPGAEPGVQPDVGMAPEGPVPDVEQGGGEPDGDEALFDGQPADGQEKPQQYAAGAPSVPSGGNTYTPSFGKKKEPVKMSRELQSQLEQQAREHEELRAQLHDMKLKFSRATREKDLIELENEGFQFDRKEELDDLQTLDDVAYAKRIALIRKRYARSPVGVTRMSRQDPLASARVSGTARSKEEVAQIVDLATRKGIEYSAAASEYDGRKVR